LRFLVALHEVTEHVGGDVVVGREVVVVRIERRHVGAEADREVRGERHEGAGDGGNDERREKTTA